MPNPLDELESLRLENAELRDRLDRSRLEADLYRRAAYEMLHQRENENPPSEEEILELVNSPRGESLHDILAQFESSPKDA